MVRTNHTDVLILGAGIIGTFTALELVKSGKNVIMVDRQIPGSATSFGNAGVLNRGSIIPFNNPDLIKQLPLLISKQKTGFDYKLNYVLKELSWALKFMSHCSVHNTLKRAKALNNLISRSAHLYRKQLPSSMLNDRGWFKLYRGELPNDDSLELTALHENNVRFERLKPEEVHDLEPAINDKSLKALWIKDTMALKDPQETVLFLAQTFENMGGEFIRTEVCDLIRENGKWIAQFSNNDSVIAEHVLISLGPWSKGFMKKLNIHLPMAFERGAHREFEEGKLSLNRPIHDTDGGYVITPLNKRWRVTCGVELAAISSPRSIKQMDAACSAMQKTITPGMHIEKPDWLGSRPTLPDSMPIIGATKHKNLWISTGHQHIGMASAPASAELITNMISNQRTQFDSSPFSPGRYNI